MSRRRASHSGRRLAQALLGLAVAHAGAAVARPDPPGLEAYAGAVEAEADHMLQADASFTASLRAAFQKGSQDSARAALVAYANAVQALLSAQPQPPRLQGCLARASTEGSGAGRLAQAALTRRLQRVQSLSAITYRPLALPDFASVVTDPATGQKEAQAVKAGLARALAQVDACRREAERRAAARPSQTEAGH